LLGSLLGGNSSNLLGSLLSSGLLGSLTGSGGSTNTTGGTSNLPPEVLQMIEDAGIDISGLNLKSKDSATDSTATGAKTSTLTQQSNTNTTTTTSTEDRSFGARWADAMFSTFFTAITVGFQTQDFINILKDAFRPFLIPGSSSSTSDTTDGTTQDPNNGGSI
jgi:hypothetical protein